MSKNEKMQNRLEAKKDVDSGNIKRSDNIHRRIIFILVGFFIVVLIFSAIIFIVGMKIDFFNRWVGGQYFGEIIEINGNSFVIKGREGIEKIVLINEDTVIKKGRETIEDALRVGNQVIIIGSLNEKGQIEARLIRIFNPDDMQNSRRAF